MPERPDLEYQLPILQREVTGLSVTGVRVRDPLVLRVAIAGTPASLLVDCTIVSVSRRAHFVVFDLGAVDVVVHPMLAGRFYIDAADRRDRGDTTVALQLSDGRELRYGDKVRMGKFYIVDRDGWDKVPGLTTIGLDVLNPKVFTFAAFKKLAKKRRDQVKLFLKDKTQLDSMGNAYADEVLFAAGLHPKTRTNKLSDDDLKILHKAIVNVLTHARDEIAGREPALHEKIRDFLKVRNRKGEPCPICGTKIRSVGVRGFDAFICPECQPDQSGGFINWRKK